MRRFFENDRLDKRTRSKCYLHFENLIVNQFTQVGVREDLAVKCLMIGAGGQVNQNILMAGSQDGSLVMFNRRYGRIDFRIQGHETEVAHIVSNTTHSRVISAGNDYVIRVWRMYPFAEEALAPMFSYYTVCSVNKYCFLLTAKNFILEQLGILLHFIFQQTKIEYFVFETGFFLFINLYNYITFNLFKYICN